jgi:hypothetical protein
MTQPHRYRGVNRIPASVASDATGDPPPATRPARLRPVERGSCEDDVWVTTRDGVRLAVRDCGSPDAYHTVVFLHGFCLSQASWACQIDHLLRRYGGQAG